MFVVMIVFPDGGVSVSGMAVALCGSGQTATDEHRRQCKAEIDGHTANKPSILATRLNEGGIHTNLDRFRGRFQNQR
jgi:hypothetical protein